MKKITLFLVICQVCSITIHAQMDSCARNTEFGSKSICLPLLKGYQECYMTSPVKEMADGTEVPQNTVLGFYLNQETYDRKDSLGNFAFDDYLKVYGTKAISSVDAGQVLLNEIRALLANNFISKNWDTMKKEIDQLDLQVEVGVPIIVKNYSLNDSSFTFVLLANYTAAGEAPDTRAMTINGLLLKDRLVWVAYYLNYVDENTITELEQKTNLLVNQFLLQNN